MTPYQPTNDISNKQTMSQILSHDHPELLKEECDYDIDFECQSQIPPPRISSTIFKDMERQESWGWEITLAQPLCMVYCTDEDESDEEVDDDHIPNEAPREISMIESIRMNESSSIHFNVLKDVSNVIVHKYHINALIEGSTNTTLLNA